MLNEICKMHECRAALGSLFLLYMALPEAGADEYDNPRIIVLGILLKKMSCEL